MTLRAEDPGKNLLDLPGGFVDKNENFEKAAMREVKEELNIELKDTKPSTILTIFGLGVLVGRLTH